MRVIFVPKESAPRNTERCRRISNGSSHTKSRALAEWVAECAQLTQPDHIVWCDGSEAERQRFTEQAVSGRRPHPAQPGKAPQLLPASFQSQRCRAHRTAHLRMHADQGQEAGPTNNWSDPAETYAKMAKWFNGSMRGRTMYVIPYVMGPLGSPLSKVGVEITDSIYVALSMRIMTRMGAAALAQLGASDDFNKGLHCTLDLNPERRLICHFPQDNTIWSIGSGYGGNALLSKKCFALRIASWSGKTEGWLAEHMLIVGVQDPRGETTYIAAAFPSACGKTNLAMLLPPPGAREAGMESLHPRR